MHTIRKVRNLAVKEQEVFEGSEAEAVLNAWAGIKAWAKNEGHQTSDLL